MKVAYTMNDQVENLKEAGELVEIDREVDWNYEIPAFESLSGKLAGPAFLFNKIKDCPGWRATCGHFGGPITRQIKRFAIAMGMGPDVSEWEFMEEMIRRSANLIKPIEISAATAPVKEVKKFGKDVNLLEIPFTYHAIGDSARYTFHSVTNYKDPDSPWQGTGQYCTQIYSKNRLTITPYFYAKIVGLLTSKYEPRNQPMPVAIAVGAPPALYASAVTLSLPGIHELELASAFQMAPMEVVKAETADILVPANAQMIIEGEIRPYERLPEGPKIESFAFSAGPRQMMYAIRVSCITQRKDPILADLIMSRGCQWALGRLCYGITPNAGLRGLESLAGLKFPFKGVLWQQPDLGHINLQSLQNTPYPEYMREELYNLIHGISLFTPGPPSMLLDEDVDVFDVAEVFEAWHNRTNPARDWIQQDDQFAKLNIFCPYAEEDEHLKKYHKAGQHRVNYWLYDATTKEEPPEGVKRTDFETLYPEDVQKWVVDNWDKLGTGEEVMWKDYWLKLKRLY